jgi:multiple sugar transport system ATP-binding protein
VDTPQRLYHEPQDVFVAAFIGTPAMNLVEATIDGDEARFGRFRIPLDSSRRPPRDYRKVTLGIRPEAFEAADAAPAGSPTIDVEPAVVEELGSDAHVFFPVDAKRIAIDVEESERETGMLLAQEAALFSARIDPRVDAAVGRPLTLAVDPGRFHFFDVETGVSLLAASKREAAGSLPDQLAPAVR